MSSSELVSPAVALQAKTTIPGLGKPITAVDVTYDGNWVLATTDDYLMVVKTSYTDAGVRHTRSVSVLIFTA